jgi:hypothetical protein
MVTCWRGVTSGKLDAAVGTSSVAEEKCPLLGNSEGRASFELLDVVSKGTVS